MRKNKLLLLLALLLTAATGAWADGVTMKEITSSDIQSSWNGNTDPVKATDLPGFKAMTHDEAIALGAPSNDEKVYLIYAINASNKFAALIYEYGTKSSYETEFNLKELQSSAQNYWVYYTYSDAPAGYTVSLKEGTKDAKNWSIASGEKSAKGDAADGLTGLKEKDAVTLTYNGRLKVKGVKATSDAVPATVPVTAITLNKTATTIEVGNNETLSVSSITPDNATDQTVTWSSDNEAVATVDADGKVTAVAAGTAIITATAHDGSEVTATCSVSVTPAYYSKMTSCGSSGMDQIMILKDLGRGYTSYNSSLTAAQAWELAKYRATVDGKTTYVIMSSQDSGYSIHYALSTDAAATEHVSDADDLVDAYSSTILNMYYIAQ